MQTTADSHGARLERLGGLVAGVVIAAIAAGCTASGASPSTTAALSAAPQASASATLSISPAATIAESESPSLGPEVTTQTSPSKTPASAPSKAPTSAPTASQASFSKGIKWTAGGAVFPAKPAAWTQSDEVTVFGWSGGYVGFRSASLGYNPPSPSPAIMGTSSTDGIHWTALRALDVSGLDIDIRVGDVVQGPAGLVAIGHYFGRACGGPDTVNAMWSSPNGLTWTRVTPPADFASAAVYTLQAGSTGYIATGVLSGTQAVGTQAVGTQALWISTDGRTWRRGSVPRSSLGPLSVHDATDFSGGFVVAGAVSLGSGGCSGEGEDSSPTPVPARYQPAIWWSSDGSAWTPSSLPGATPVESASMRVTRVNDHLLMAVAHEGTFDKPVDVVWRSGDGKTWTLVQNRTGWLDNSEVVTDGRRGLLLTRGYGTDPSKIAALADDLGAKELTQSGSGPDGSMWMWSGDCALGPAGLVVPYPGNELWVGVPAN